MSDTIRLGKLDAARRQLSAAIQIIFEDGDPVVAHTLAGAASNILTDLVEHEVRHKSWDKFAQDANNLTPNVYFNIMRAAQNFLKHASKDPDGELELNPSDTESLAFFATMNLGEILSHRKHGQLSLLESTFQLWYIACYAPELEGADGPFELALQVFGDLRGQARVERLSAGKKMIEENI